MKKPFAKKTLVLAMAVILAGCASMKQKVEEHRQLHAIHKAEKKIAAGNASIVAGTALVASGTATVAKGKKELKAAQEQLSQSVGITKQQESQN